LDTSSRRLEAEQAVTKVAAIVGPTAVGKTTAAVAVARRLGAEIVSVDSMQIYEDMDVGTDKPPPALRALARHHLLDLKDPSEELTVAEYQSLARAAVAEVSSRGRLPLLVGGSGLYFRAVVDDLRFPPRRLEVRQALEAEAERSGPEALHERLRARDPDAAACIDPKNARRIVRALEVIEITHGLFSESRAWDRYRSIYELAVAGLTMSRGRLHERIAQRADGMLEAGLLQEVETLRQRGLGATARQALGYRQIIEASPDAPLQDVRESIIRATRRFARRQEAWFKADPRIKWFDASHERLIDVLTAHFRTCLALP